MMETEIKKFTGHGLPNEKGTWKRLHGVKSSTWLCCPNCGLSGALDHEVDAQGNVTPSVDCPECEYHETGVKLLDWSTP